MNKVTKLVVSIGVGILCISFCSVNIQAEEPALPDFVITDTQFSPQTVHEGEQVLVTAMLGNLWPLTVGELNTLDVQVGFSINENVTFQYYKKTSCANATCPPNNPGGLCVDISQCIPPPGLQEWDEVKCYRFPIILNPCRCVYFVEVEVQVVFPQPGIYRVGFVADPNLLIAESNETNNSQIIEIEVLPIIITK